MDITSILLVLATLGNIILGLLIYLRNRKSAVNLLFGFLSLLLSLWCGLMIVFLKIDNIDLLLLSKILHWLAAIAVSVFLYFTFIFPEESKKPNRIMIFLIILGTLVMTPIIINSDFIIKEVNKINDSNIAISFGSGYFSYFLYITFYTTASLANLIIKIKKTHGIEKQQIKYLFAGIVVLVSTSLIFNLTMPYFGIFKYQWYGQVSTFVMLGFMTYAIMKLYLLEVKIVAAEFFTFIMWVFILIRLLTADTSQERMLNGGFLIFITVFGLLLVKSVIKEVRAREEIEELATKLEFANLRLKQLDEAKSDFLSIASHQLRTPLTAIKGYASMILEGSYGKISEATKNAVDKISQSSQRLVLIIGDFLDISHIEQGAMQYDFAPVDLRELARGLTDEFKATVESSADKSKTLKISFGADEKENFKITADYNKIRQVVSNLIDNSIKYTPEGFVKVSLSKTSENRNVLLKIEDSGIGISAETMPNLLPLRQIKLASLQAAIHPQA